MTIGFIIIRYIHDVKTNEYWINCYNSIRKYYKDNIIMIIDDNSPQNYELCKIKLHNCFLVNVDKNLSQRGELLAYYYYYKYKLFDTAVIIHDSVFIQKYVDFENVDVKMLWHFDMYTCDFKHIKSDIKEYICKLNNSDILIDIYENKKWYGCFGVMSVISWSYLKYIVDKYNFLILLDYLKNRQDRKCLERIFGIILFNEGICDSVFGKIHNNFNKYYYWGFSYENYIELKNKSNGNLLKYYPSFIKIWSGR